MLKLKFVSLFLFLLLLALGACGSSPASDNKAGASPAEAQASAQAALGRLDGQTGRPAEAPSAPSLQQPSSGSSSSPSTPQQAVLNNSRTKPAWVDSVDSVYGRSQYAAAVGYASNRDMAEKNAIANLAAIFGQSIKADQTITNTYQEAARNGVTAGWTDNITMQNTIKTSASMDTLVGAEIKEVWFDSRSTYYAAAVMEKTKTAQLYNEMIKANQNMIDNLIKMNQADKNSLEGFSRYQFAAVVADINVTYGNLLQVIGSPLPSGLIKGDNYRLEAQSITKSIPVGITVRNDKSGRIRDAFAKAFSDIGFRSGGNNSRYILNVDITVSPVDYPNNPNKFARIELSANLTDTSDRSVLLPYNFNEREGHTTISEAENRAYMTGERKINNEYKILLTDYLSGLLPKK
jgi:hypothetical protein